MFIVYVGRLKYTLHSLRLPEELSSPTKQQKMEGTASETHRATAL